MTREYRSKMQDGGVGSSAYHCGKLENQFILIFGIIAWTLVWNISYDLRGRAVEEFSISSSTTDTNKSVSAAGVQSRR